MSVEDDEMIKEYYADTIEPLIQYDEINGTGYVDFLKVHFETGGNIQKTAGRLYLHRNSVIYKIHKIEEILGVRSFGLNRKDGDQSGGQAARSVVTCCYL